MVSQVFWFVATLEVVLSIGFAVLVRKVPTPDLSARHPTLARSQGKDNWLACAVIWIVVFSEGYPMRQALVIPGAMILAWLARRTLYRVRSLQSRS